MAVVITQEKRGRKSIYHVKNLDEAGVPVSDETYCVGVELRTVFKTRKNGSEVFKEVKKGEHRGGQVVVCVVDGDGVLDEDIYNYINNIREAESLKTRKMMGYALGTYKMFMQMTDHDAKHPTYQNIEEYRLFLMGRTVVPEPGSSVTYRCANTCNAYMSTAKMFLLLTKNDCSAFEEIESRGMQHTAYTDIYGRRRVAVTGRNPHHVRRDPLAGKELPAHPKPEQVRNILKMALSDPVQGVYWGIYTQFRTGIRCGGLLGLTLEDLCEEHNGDEVEYYLYLRNRVSDADFQFCKNLYHPTTVEEYGSSSYRESFQRIHISKKLYDGLRLYYTVSRDERNVGAKKRMKILQNTKADSIYGKTHTNYYIFIHPNGSLLSGQTYNNHLKPLFEANGVTLDKGYKKYNCSHQLRAAFLMFRGRYSENPETLLQLARDAGHASPQSTLSYYNEFPEDIKARWEQFDEELDELIPEFENIEIKQNDEPTPRKHNKSQISSTPRGVQSNRV